MFFFRLYSKDHFLFQVGILEGALSLHGRLAPPDLQPLQKRLVELFKTMKQGIKNSVSITLFAKIGLDDIWMVLRGSLS